MSLITIPRTPKTPPGWFAVFNSETHAIAFCGPPKAPGEAGQGYVISVEDMAIMHLELLATVDAKIEAAEIEQRNIGSRLTAATLLKIARTGEHHGVFGDETLEECAQVILHLHERLGHKPDDMEELIVFLTQKLDDAEKKLCEAQGGRSEEDIPY